MRAKRVATVKPEHDNVLLLPDGSGFRVQGSSECSKTEVSIVSSYGMYCVPLPNMV
jgi:hypothetical protein